MKNAIYFDYGNGSADLIIEGLEKEGKYKFPIWIDNARLFFKQCEREKRQAVREPDFDWHHLREGDIVNYEYKPLPLDFKQKFYKEYFSRYMRQASREDIKTNTNVSFYNDRTPYANSTLYAQQNVFYVLLNFFYHLIKKHNIEMIYFNDIPHDGSDIVLHGLAIELDIRIHITHRCILFHDKFFCTHSIDFGDYIDLPSRQEVIPYNRNVSKKAKPAYNVMPRIHKQSIDHLDEYITHRYLHIRPKLHRMPRYIGRLLKPFFAKPQEDDRKALNKQLNYIARYLNFSKYMDTLAKYQEDSADLTGNFIFFPLHFQPEATTLARGKEYYDQLLALEIISDLIPHDWKIYVKDHYLTQEEFMRDESFWLRFRGLKKVRLLSKEVSSYDLMEKAQLIATITGTAGYEALLAGKRVLVFGDAWYKHFTGVVNMHNNITLDEILNCEVNIGKVCVDIGLLESKMYDGVPDCDSFSYFEGGDAKENIRTRIRSLSQIFGG